MEATDLTVLYVILRLQTDLYLGRLGPQPAKLLSDFHQYLSFLFWHTCHVFVVVVVVVVLCVCVGVEKERERDRERSSHEVHPFSSCMFF